MDGMREPGLLRSSQHFRRSQGTSNVHPFDFHIDCKFHVNLGLGASVHSGNGSADGSERRQAAADLEPGLRRRG